MKANRKSIRTDDEAVSPVIGVILMVAITVVLAAVVFVLVQNLGKGAEKAPDMGFSKDSTGYKLTVVKAPVGGDLLKWSDGTTTGNVLLIGGDCVLSSGGDDNTNVVAGDILQIDSTSAPCDITFTHTPTGTLVYTTNFT